MLAVAGVSSATSAGGDEKEISSIQFYTPFGQVTLIQTPETTHLTAVAYHSFYSPLFFL